MNALAPATAGSKLSYQIVEDVAQKGAFDEVSQCSLWLWQSPLDTALIYDFVLSFPRLGHQTDSKPGLCVAHSIAIPLQHHRSRQRLPRASDHRYDEYSRGGQIVCTFCQTGCYHVVLCCHQKWFDRCTSVLRREHLEPDHVGRSCRRFQEGIFSQQGMLSRPWLLISCKSVLLTGC